jgi:hypothetical protein
MHKMNKDKATKVWTIKPEKECAFVVKQIDAAKKEKPCDQNAGSYIKIANYTESAKVGFHMRWRFASRAILRLVCAPLQRLAFVWFSFDFLVSFRTGIRN